MYKKQKKEIYKSHDRIINNIFNNKKLQERENVGKIKSGNKQPLALKKLNTKAVHNVRNFFRNGVKIVREKSSILNLQPTCY